MRLLREHKLECIIEDIGIYHKIHDELKERNLTYPQRLGVYRNIRKQIMQEYEISSEELNLCYRIYKGRV